MDQPSEQSLILRSQRGDAKAFDQLMRLTARWVYARLAIAIHDRTRAEDLTQEAFLRAWRSIDLLDDPQRFRPWLAVIIRSVVLDHLRGEHRLKRSADRVDTDADTLAAEAALPIEQMEQDEQRRRLLAALGELPESYRDVLSLRYLAGCDYEAICKQTGLSNGALRGLLGRGLKLLREKMTSCEVQS